MLMSSLLVAVLTSALTVRGMQQAAGAAPSQVAMHAQPVTVIAAAPAPLARDSAPVRTMPTADSASTAVATHTDTTRDHEEAGAVAPALGRDATVADAGASRARAEACPATRATTSLFRSRSTRAPHHPPRSVPPPPPQYPRTHSRPTRDQRTVARGALDVRTFDARTRACRAGRVQPSPLANQRAVLEELRAIHAEINARKRHMDSLTAALDSLNHVRKPD